VRFWGVYENEQLLCRHWTAWAAHKCLIRRAMAAWELGQFDGPEQAIRRAQ